MKNCKKMFVILLSFILVFTLIPSSFASSSNSVEKAVSVTENDKIPSTTIDFEVRNSGRWSSTEQTITISLDGAEWNIGDKTDVLSPINTTVPARLIDTAKSTLLTVDFSNDDKTNTTSIAGISVKNVKMKSLELTINFTNLPTKNDVITLRFGEDSLKVTGNSGEDVIVSIDEGSSDFTGGDYVIANIKDGGTTTAVSGTVKSFSYGSLIEGAEVRIKEDVTTAISTGNQVLKLTLPKEVTWSANGDELFKDISGTAIDNFSISQYETKVNSYNDLAPGQWYRTTDNRVLYICLPLKGIDSSIQTLYLTPQVKIGKKASTGDINLSITSVYAQRGDKIDASNSLTIAKYKEETVDVYTISDIPTIIAGRVTNADDKYYWVEVDIRENVAGALSLEKEIDFDFPEEVQVVTEAMYADAGVRMSLDKNDTIDDADKATSLEGTGIINYDDGVDFINDTSDFSITMPVTAQTYHGKSWKFNEANTIKLFIPITVKADYVGEIPVEVSGKDFDDITLIVGEAVAPLKINTEITPVPFGIKGNRLADITIEESEAGLLGDGKGDELTLILDTHGITNGYSLDNSFIEPVFGDLDIDTSIEYGTAHNGDGAMFVKVRNPSTELSAFEIIGTEISTTTILPEGEYKIGILVDNQYTSSGEAKRDAIIQNGNFDNGKFGKDKNVIYSAVPYVGIVDDTKTSYHISEFVIGRAEYTVDNATYRMDVAPYIDAANRTMIPIRFVAQAVGIGDTDISYSDGSATISAPSNVITVTADSAVLQTSNGMIIMDTVAVNENNRLYVPARFLAQALGAQVNWNQQTKTVSFIW